MTDPMLDPKCVRAKQLRAVYDQRIMGGAVKSITTKAGGGEKKGEWYQTDISVLRAEMIKAEDECRAVQGLPPLQRRFAIAAGSRRTMRTRF